MKTSFKILPQFLMTAALAAVLAASAANAQTNLQPQIVLRPLTAVDVSTYGLAANSDLSGGLTTIGIGTPAYLEVEVSTKFPASNIVSVTWAINNEPVGSLATLQPSPLGTNVPIYEPSDRLINQVAQPGGRTVLRPDLVGQYVVQATITTTSGVTNLSQTITASTYLGVATCELCHSGGQIAEDKWTTWSQTLHSQVFADEIDGIANFAGAPMRQSCLQCHTTGYDTNAPEDDGGFANMAAEYGWTIPAVITNGNWASMQTNYPYVAALANVQCESCHGPGYAHASLLGNTNSPNWPGVAVNYTSGDCQQCHDDAPYHPYGTEWLNSVHAVATTIPAGKSECVGCHTAYGFIARVESITNGISSITNLDSITTNDNLSYAPINCQTCHEPHGNTIPTNNLHMIRVLASVTLQDGTVVTNAGEGLLCMECHQSREAAANASSSSSVASGIMAPQADMLEGVNGYTYGQALPSSDHASVSNTCVTCHMQIIADTDPAFLYAGSHTFNVSWAGNTTNPPEDLVAACQQCHGSSVTSFNFPVEDFDGSGVIQGVQTQVQTLLNQLALLLPGGEENVGSSRISPTASWTAPELEAAYNYNFVEEDGSLGVHNTAYAVALLQASIANLTGVSAPGELPTAWVDEYFGSVTNPAAAPDAINNTNGIPNWVMYALGLNPTQSGITVPGGVVWMDGNNLINSGATNTVEIYTAAEISFNTVAGNTYQIQGISALSSGWQNIGNPIAGTGDPVSYLTPTRNNPQMFFRVITNP